MYYNWGVLYGIKEAYYKAYKFCFEGILNKIPKRGSWRWFPIPISQPKLWLNRSVKKHKSCRLSGYPAQIVIPIAVHEIPFSQPKISKSQSHFTPPGPSQTLIKYKMIDHTCVHTKCSKSWPGNVSILNLYFQSYKSAPMSYNTVTLYWIFPMLEIQNSKL